VFVCAWCEFDGGAIGSRRGTQRPRPGARGPRQLRRTARRQASGHKVVASRLDFTRNYWSAAENDRTVLSEQKLAEATDLDATEPDETTLLTLNTHASLVNVTYYMKATPRRTGGAFYRSKRPFLCDNSLRARDPGQAFALVGAFTVTEPCSLGYAFSAMSEGSGMADVVALRPGTRSVTAADAVEGFLSSTDLAASTRAYDTAARADELLGLNVEHIDLANRTAVIIGKGRGRKPRGSGVSLQRGRRRIAGPARGGRGRRSRGRGRWRPRSGRRCRVGRLPSRPVPCRAHPGARIPPHRALSSLW
jgi:hypothetical protein